MRLREFTNDTVANWRTIAARNNLANPDLILPGQVLDIGDGIVLPKGTTYTVKPGDTLSGIAQNIRKGKMPDSDSSTTVAPKPPVSSSQPGYHDPVYDAPKAKSSKPGYHDPSYDAPKAATPPEINLPRVGPPEVKRGRPTMPADRDQTRPPTAKSKPTRPDYHDPAYDAPPDEAPVDDAEIKRRIGADQPIPSYKYTDKDKDKAMSDKLQQQDRAKQQLPQGRSKPNKAPKDRSGAKTSSSEFDKIRGIESGNRDYDDYGRPITSPKGAKFAAQVMPATNTNPGYGVKPAADAGHEESNRVGKDYFNAMKNKYGNSELAAAAYNAGPGRLDKILQKAKETGRHWKEMLPAETQKYLEKFKSK
jgi:hypothetical protein